MKKLISLILALGMLAASSACAFGQKAPAEPTPDETGGAAPIDAIAPDTILDLFADMTDIGLDGFLHVAVDKEDAGLEMGYAGFDGAFASAMALKPLMSTSPFVLMVYRLAAGADAAAFAADIEKNANPGKWICVRADRVFTRVSGRTVLFVMCPENMAQPIADCFAEMSAEGFDPDAHLVNPLADKSVRDVYEELYQIFSAEAYGFMDNEALSALDADTAYGLSGLDLARVEQSVFDDGYAAANAEDPERAYVLAILKVRDGASERALAEDVRRVLDTAALPGGEASRLVAFGSGFVIVYAGTGTYGVSAAALESYLPITYRLSAAAF